MSKRKLISLIVVVSLLFQIISVPLAYATEPGDGAAGEQTGSAYEGEPTPTPEGTAEPTPTPEGTSEPTPTPEGTAEPTPTPEGTAEPTPTPEGTAEPTQTPGVAMPPPQFGPNSNGGGAGDSVPPAGDITGTEYLIIHGAQIVINGANVVQNGNVFTGIRPGDTINMQIGFTLPSGDGEEILYEYNSSHYFYINLPEGISFNSSTDSAHPETIGDIATWYIDNSGGNSRIKVQLTNAIGADGVPDGAIYLNGTFDSSEGGGENGITMELGNQTYVFKRQQIVPGAPTVEKTGSYSAEENIITWTVKVKAPATQSAPFDFSGYTIVDEYSDNQTYVPNSFTILSGAALVPGNLSLETDDQTISYTFPEGTEASEITITYQTTPITAAEGENMPSSGNSSFENTATLRDETNGWVADDDHTVTIDWVEKTGTADGITLREGKYVIKWTVTVNVREDGAKIVDTFPNGLTLIKGDPLSGTHPITIGEALIIEGTGEGEYVYAGNTLTYTFENGFRGLATLIYYTEVDPEALDNNDAVKFENNVTFSWTNMYGDAPGASEEVGIVGGGGIINKSAQTSDTVNYNDKENRYIKWTINVNRNTIDVGTVLIQIQDTIPAGQVLVVDNVGHPFTVTGSQSSETIVDIAASTRLNVLDEGNGFTYSFENAISSLHTITYYTEIVDASLNSLYNTNDATVSFGNSVEILNKAGESSGATQTFNSQMLEKKAGDYNYADHTVKWEIVVNRNQLPMTDAVVTDAIPAGMVLFIDSTHPFTVANDTDSAAENPIAIAPTTGASGSTSFEYSFGSISDQYTITFYTKVTDATLMTQGEKTFENEAELDAEEIDAPIVVTADVSMTNPVVSKTASFNNATDTIIKWTVAINPANVALSGAYVTDELNENLRLDINSVKLYEATVNAETGVVTATATEVTLPVGAVIYPAPSPAAANTLRVNLLDGAGIYVLEFETAIENVNSVNIVNKVTLSGNVSSPSGNGEADMVTVRNFWSRGTTGSQSLTVKKVDATANGNPLKGAKFQLLNKNGLAIDNAKMRAESNENGLAVFANIPDWAYYVREVDPPAGYLLNTPLPVRQPAGDAVRPSDIVPAEEGIAYVFTNARGLDNIEFIKTGEDGAPLAGAQFTLEAVGGKSLDGEAFNPMTVTSSSATGAEGKVLFSNIPMGTYTLKEVSTPNGYWLPADEYVITIGYNSDKTDTVVKWTQNGQAFNPEAGSLLREINNEVALADIEFGKMGVGGAPLEGGTFRLTGESDLHGAWGIGEGNEIIEAAVNGKVTFEDVPIGTYEIEELTAPDDYLPSKKIIEVQISYEDEETQSGIKVEYRFQGDEEYSDEITLENLPIPDVELIKHDASGNVLEGAEFALYDSDDDQVGDSVVSDEHGVVLFEKVLPGEYTIREVDPVNGYLLSGKVVQVVVGYDENETWVRYIFADSEEGVEPSDEPLTFANVEGRADVSFNKIGMGPRLDENGVALPDGTFKLFGESILFGDIEFTESPVDGVVTFKNISMGEYTIVEVDPPTGYLYSGAVIHVSVEYADGEEGGMDKTAVKVLYWLETEGEGEEPIYSTTLPIFENERGVHDIQFTKTGWEGALLDGGTFRLVGTSIDEFTEVDETAEAVDGVVKFTDVPMGTYTITETAAPDGYLKPGDYLEGQDRPNSKIEVRIDYANEEKTETKVEYRWLDGEEMMEFAEDELAMENWLIPSIKLIKVNEAGERLSHAVFVLYNFEGEFVQRVSSNRKGVVLFERVMPGHYTIKEVRSPVGYDPYPEVIPVTVTPGADVDVIALPDVVNTQAELGAIRVTKVSSETGAVLRGATFGLYDSNGNLLATGVTDSDGIVEFRDLYPAKYIVRETKAPSGYLKDEMAYGINVEWRTVHEITVKNASDPNWPQDPDEPYPMYTPRPEAPGPQPTLPDSYVPGSTLPQAGELWDATFISILGGALILGGIAIVVVKRRRSAKG